MERPTRPDRARPGDRPLGTPDGSLRVGVLGDGRLGTALARALRSAGVSVDGPARRGELPRGDVILLCVPDGEIAAAAEAVAGRARFVGHPSGSAPLRTAEPAARAGSALFGLHPLLSITASATPTDFAGAGCAIAGTTPEAVDLARTLATTLGMRPFEISDEHRPAYHAAASIASNFLVTLEYAAERVAAGAGLSPADARTLLAPLVRGTVENWATLGPADALTGPLTRGDEATVARQRTAVDRVAPDLLSLFDELTRQTRVLVDAKAKAV